VKLYKYRDLTNPNYEAFSRLSDIIRKNEFWCAAPATLNDDVEFLWKCDYTPTRETVSHLANALIKFRNRTPAQALDLARKAVANQVMEQVAAPFIDEIIAHTRSEVGLACFATSPDNPVMWKEYGGDGAGVCIELTAPRELLNNQLHEVRYLAEKIVHIDQLLEASTSGSQRSAVYSIALLSKPPKWAPEAEVRFISKRQNASVNIQSSHLSNITLGPNLDAATVQRIYELVESLSYRLPVVHLG
jgi:hypothetical protein